MQSTRSIPTKPGKWGTLSNFGIQGRDHLEASFLLSSPLHLVPQCTPWPHPNLLTEEGYSAGLESGQEERTRFCWGILRAGQARVRGNGEPSWYLRNYAGGEDFSGVQ